MLGLLRMITVYLENCYRGNDQWGPFSVDNYNICALKRTLNKLTPTQRFTSKLLCKFFSSQYHRHYKHTIVIYMSAISIHPLRFCCGRFALFSLPRRTFSIKQPPSLSHWPLCYHNAYTMIIKIWRQWLIIENGTPATLIIHSLKNFWLTLAKARPTHTLRAD